MNSIRKKSDSELLISVKPSHRYHTLSNAAEKSKQGMWTVSQKLYVVLKSEKTILF